MTVSRRYFLKQGGVAMVGLSAHARIFAARGGGDADAQQETIGGVVSARRGGWLEHRGALCRAELLPLAPDHRDSSTRPRRRESCGDRSGRILRIASQPRATGAAVSSQPAGHRACGGFAGSHAFAFRRAGFHGIGHAGRESHRRRLAESRHRKPCPEENASPFRAVAMGPNLPRMLRGSAGAIALPDMKQFQGHAAIGGDESRAGRL